MERRNRAINLRSLSYPWEYVAKECGYRNASTACRDVLSTLEKRRHETFRHVDAFIQQELEKLDMIERLMWRVVNRKHVLAQNGRVVLDPVTQEAMQDDGPLFQATDRLLKIHERRSKLLGLDSPARVDIKVNDEMDERIKRLMEQMGNPVQPEVEAPVDHFQ
jgi:hypothetical protein